MASRRRILAGMLSTVLVAALPPRGASPVPTEYEVKAAFLYNFARFVEWPAEARGAADQPFVVGILGDDPFGATLDRTLLGKTLEGRPIVVRRMASLEQESHVNILFVGGSDKAELARVVRALSGTPVLTVGEMAGFAEHGGMIGFRTESQRVRFDINAEQASRAGLKISSQLLKLARIVASGNRE
jgi:hypothetical protein